MPLRAPRGGLRVEQVSFRWRFAGLPRRSRGSIEYLPHDEARPRDRASVPARLAVQDLSDWTAVGPPAGRPELASVIVRGREIALARLHDGSWVAFDNACTHEDCPLAEGDLVGERIVCVCHSSAFDVRTGEVLEGPAEEPISVYPVRIEDGELRVLVR
jgi:3-phenylpropionate/trans-cinnamate dioxygenase ferredoxin subunit